MTLTPNQRAVLSALVAEVNRCGVCPTHARLVALCPGVARGSIASTVSALRAWGYVQKPQYRGAPIEPVRDELNNRVRVAVLPEPRR